MKNLALLIMIFLLVGCSLGKEKNLELFLRELPGSIIEKIENGDSLRETYKVLIRQRINHFFTEDIPFTPGFFQTSCNRY